MAKYRSGVGVASTALAVAVTAPLLTACVRPHAARSHDETIRTRTLAWPGGDRLFVAASADVRYVQGQDAKVVMTGPTDLIDDIVVDDGVIRYDRRRWRWGWWSFGWRHWGSPPVQIVVTAPQVTDAGVGGSGRLDLGHLSQDHLGISMSGSGAIEVSGRFKTLDLSVSGSGAGRLDQVQAGDMTANLSGSGWIRGSGSADTLHLSVSGSGVADMGGLEVQDAETDVSGSGSARISPKQSADVSVFGSGSVRLLTQPPRLSTHRSGSGAIIGPAHSS